MEVIYLDSNHLSRLARQPNDAACVAIKTHLDGDKYRLALNLLLLQELSAPTFASRSNVGRMLDTIPVAWAPPLPAVFDQEVRWAIDMALSAGVTNRSVFSESFEYGMHAPPEARIPVSEMLEVMATREDLRSHLPEAAQYGVIMDASKRSAAVMRDPNVSVLARISELSSTRTSQGVFLQSDYPPSDILSRAGGLPGLPAYHVFQSLARQRLNDPTFHPSPNDLFDEWHASYAPYASIIALDRRTAARLLMAHPSLSAKVTNSLEGVVGMLVTTV